MAFDAENGELIYLQAKQVPNAKQDLKGDFSLHEAELDKGRVRLIASRKDPNAELTLLETVKYSYVQHAAVCSAAHTKVAS